MLNLLNRVTEGHVSSAATMLVIAHSTVIPLAALLLSKEITLIVIDLGRSACGQHFGHFIFKPSYLILQSDFFADELIFGNVNVNDEQYMCRSEPSTYMIITGRIDM
jgi:hypothetical protein